MKYTFDLRFIKGNEVTFYVFLIVMLLIFIFAGVATYKEIKHETK